MEITQFTYFQQVGGIECELETGEITYGLERLAMYIQEVDSVYDLKWNDEMTYGDIFKSAEYENSMYALKNVMQICYLTYLIYMKKKVLS